MAFCRYVVTNKGNLWSASYSACVVYTSTITHLSVSERGGYLPPLVFGELLLIIIHQIFLLVRDWSKHVT